MQAPNFGKTKINLKDHTTLFAAVFENNKMTTKGKEFLFSIEITNKIIYSEL